MTKYLDFSAFLSILLILSRYTVGIVIPYDHIMLPLLWIVAIYWFWSRRDLFAKATHSQFNKFRPAIEVVFLISTGYLLLRHILFSSDLIFGMPLVASLLRFVDYPVIALLLSGLLLVIYSKPTKSVIDEIEAKISHKTAILVVAALMIIGLGVRAYNLGASEFRGDEFQVVSAATGLLYTGDYHRWNWINNEPACLDTSNGSCMYSRAWPHTWLITQTYKIFGISEWSSRIPSVIFGVLLIAVAYLLGNYFSRSVLIGILVALIATFAPSYISLSRYIRMYVLLLPLFGLLVYGLMRALHEKRVPEKLKKLEKVLPYHYPLAVISLVLLYFSYHIHVNSLVLLPAFLLYVILLALFFRSKRYVIPSLVGIIGALGGLAYIATGLFKFSGMISWFGRNNTVYFNHIYGYPLSKDLLLTLGLLAGISLVLYSKSFKQLPMKRILFLPVLLGFGTFFFIKMADRYAAFVYTSHLTLFAIIGALIVVWVLTHHLTKLSQALLLALVIVVVGLQFALNSQARYHDQGEAKHSVAYQVIIDNYNPETDALLMQYGRNYYLSGIEDPKIISMERNKTYEFQKFLTDAGSSNRIWASWESGKSYHLQDIIRAFINARFEKIHGRGIDNTRVEVYFCPDTSVCLADIESFMISYFQMPPDPEQPDLTEQLEPEEENIE